MRDFTKLDAGEMRDILVRLGCSQEEANSIKGKSNLAEAILAREANQAFIQDVGKPFENVEFEHKSLVLDSQEEVQESKDEPPKMGSPAWQDFVLSHLLPEEFQEKNGRKFPKASGLRRITQVLCGPIISSGPSMVFTSHGPLNTTTVVYNVEILWTRDFSCNKWMSESELLSMNLSTRKFSEVADCNKENTPSPYNAHASATASSKAEGRTFKKALMLNIHTAEEMGELVDEPKIVEFSAMGVDTESITHAQISVITNVSEQLHIDVKKLLEYHKFKSNDISSLSRADGAQIIVLLNKYKTTTDASLEVPSFIKSN